MEKEKLLEEFRKLSGKDLAEVKKRYDSPEFVKGAKRGFVGAELILRELLRGMK